MSAPADNSPILRVHDLCKSYAPRKGLWRSGQDAPHQPAVDRVSFDLGRGELLALVGESGSGKTTTAQCVLRLLEPDRGSVSFDGTDLLALGARELRRERRRFQLVYQDPYESLDPRMSVRATLEEPLKIHGIARGSNGRLERIERALEQVELSPTQHLERFPHQLSGGQRQRVAIAASLILGPALLVADEPVSMLDVSVRAGILALLNRLRRDGDLSVLMITHDLSTAAHVADRVGVMHRGRLVEVGNVSEVIHAPQHPYTRALIAAVPPRDPRKRGARRGILSP